MIAQGQVWIAVVVTVCLPTAVLAKTRAYTGDQDLTRAWSRFLTEGVAREPAMTFPYEHCFRRAATVHDVPISLLLAVARGESDFDAHAKSHANAHGLMQILWPTTARHLGIRRLSDLYEPCTNVDAGARYLKELLTRYRGNLHLALAAYNYGPQQIKVGARKIPTGAEWYSGYIYRHLNYVLGSGSLRPKKQVSYQDMKRFELIVFSQPYRAAAFVEAVEQAVDGVHLDWFKMGVGRFRVLVFFDADTELTRIKSKLVHAGFMLE